MRDPEKDTPTKAAGPEDLVVYKAIADRYRADRAQAPVMWWDGHLDASWTKSGGYSIPLYLAPPNEQQIRAREPVANWREPHPPSRHCMCPACIPSFDDRFSPLNEQQIRAEERERCAKMIASLHMAQTINNQNYSNDWHDAVDASIEAIRSLK